MIEGEQKTTDVEHEILKQKFQQQEQQQYQTMANQTKPKPNVIKNVLLAFLVGGIISTLGQALITFFTGQGLTSQEAGAAAASVLVFSAALLTGLGIWDNIAKYAGAGAIVPITGFANSMVAPALEFKREGMIFGVAARLFTIAGPVIVFGLVTAWLAGLMAFLLK